MSRQLKKETQPINIKNSQSEITRESQITTISYHNILIRLSKINISDRFQNVGKQDQTPNRKEDKLEIYLTLHS